MVTSVTDWRDAKTPVWYDCHQHKFIDFNTRARSTVDVQRLRSPSRCSTPTPVR
jgi:hypothetical protein